MSYNTSDNRFENTLKDLRDCDRHLDNPDNISVTEKKARKELIWLCRQIAEDYNEEKV